MGRIFCGGKKKLYPNEKPVSLCKHVPFDWLRERILFVAKKRLPDEEPPFLQRTVIPNLIRDL